MSRQGRRDAPFQVEDALLAFLALFVTGPVNFQLHLGAEDVGEASLATLSLETEEVLLAEVLLEL